MIYDVLKLQRLVFDFRKMLPRFRIHDDIHSWFGEKLWTSKDTVITTCRGCQGSLENQKRNSRKLITSNEEKCSVYLAVIINFFYENLLQLIFWTNFNGFWSFLRLKVLLIHSYKSIFHFYHIFYCVKLTYLDKSL